MHERARFWLDRHPILPEPTRRGAPGPVQVGYRVATSSLLSVTVP